MRRRTHPKAGEGGVIVRMHTWLYAFIMLAIHPHVQDTLHISEIESTLGDHVPTYDDFSDFVCPLCVMFETIQFFPPVVCIPKSIINGQQTLLGKYVIPQDVTIFFAVIGLH
jgi:hypothetical protein